MEKMIFAADALAGQVALVTGPNAGIPAASALRSWKPS